MIPTAYLTGDKKHLIFADSEIIKRHGFAGMFPLYSEKEILKYLSSLNQWQPIETAPRDGTTILIASTVRDVYYVCISRWTSAKDGQKGGWYPYFAEGVTHWQPLPLPPKP